MSKISVTVIRDARDCMEPVYRGGALSDLAKILVSLAARPNSWERFTRPLHYVLLIYLYFGGTSTTSANDGVSCGCAILLRVARKWSSLNTSASIETNPTDESITSRYPGVFTIGSHK